MNFLLGPKVFGEGNSSPILFLLLHLLSFCLLWLVFLLSSSNWLISMRFLWKPSLKPSQSIHDYTMADSKQKPEILQRSTPFLLLKIFQKKPRNNSKYNTFAAALALDAKGHATPLGSVGSAWVKCPAEPRRHSQKSWLSDPYNPINGRTYMGSWGYFTLLIGVITLKLRTYMGNWGYFTLLMGL